MPVGKTKDAGWQIGVSVTVGRPAIEVWSRLTSPDGLAIWLGSGVDLTGGAHQRYVTSTGTTGEVRGHRPQDRIRLTWQPMGWDHDTTLQIALDDRGDRTGVRFHQERLANAEEREAQRRHWKRIATELAAFIEERSSA